MAHKFFGVAQVCERDPALSSGHRAMSRQTAVKVEVIEAEVRLLQVFPLPIGLSQICGCSVSSVLSLINWRGFKLQEQAASSSIRIQA